MRKVAAAIALLLCAAAAPAATVGGAAPEITAQRWVNSPPLSLADLHGKVALVEFWTFGCYDCRNVEPYVKEGHKKYSGHGLVVIGVHSPEFAPEREVANVEAYARKNQIPYPIAIDNDFTIWDRFANNAWPAIYLIDRKGLLRHVRIGEGGYRETEQKIQELLAERAS